MVDVPKLLRLLRLFLQFLWLMVWCGVVVVVVEAAMKHGEEMNHGSREFF